MTTVFKLADKVAEFKGKLELWGRRMNRGILDMFQTLAGILGETEPEHSFSQLVHDHLSLLLKEFERYFPTTKDPRTGKKWIRDPFVKPGACLCKKINCWRLQMTAALKLRSRQQLCRCYGLKWNRLVAKKQAQGSH
ncbi:SCAN domain-containing protein 3-like [Tachysurus ichikawai]